MVIRVLIFKSNKYMDLLKMHHTRLPSFQIPPKSDNRNSRDLTLLAKKKKKDFIANSDLHKSTKTIHLSQLIFLRTPPTR